jgi:hypothetical protein
MLTLATMHPVPVEMRIPATIPLIPAEMRIQAITLPVQVAMHPPEPNVTILRRMTPDLREILPEVTQATQTEITS